MKVYKVEVSKGMEKHQLYYSIDGTLLKDKTMTNAKFPDY